MCTYTHRQIQRPYMHIKFVEKVYAYFSTLRMWCIPPEFTFVFHSLMVNICWNKGVPDRATRQFFTTTILRPNGGTAYPAVSQKVLSATSCRFMIMWCASLVAQFDLHDENHLCLGSFILWPCWYWLSIFVRGEICWSGFVGFPVFSAIIRWRRGLIGGLATMESICLKGSRWLTSDACNEFRMAYSVYRARLNLLAQWAIEKNLVRYHVRPKCHQLGHLTWHYYLPRNPQYMQCYADEDFTSRTKRVAERSHPLHMSRFTMFRYMLQICLKFSGETLWCGGARWPKSLDRPMACGSTHVFFDVFRGTCVEICCL